MATTLPRQSVTATALAGERQLVSDSSPSKPSLETASRILTGHAPEIWPEALKLSCKLQASASENDRVILVTGLDAEEYSSQFAVQLALGLSEIDEQLVLLVDANLRKPSLHRDFGIEQQPGLVNVLDGTARLDGAARIVKPTLAVLPVGGSRPDSAIFTSAEFSGLLERQLRPQFRFIIVTSAPFTQFVDASLIASRADGVVIAVTAGRHRRAELLDLKGELEALKAKVFGVVLCENE